MIADPSPVRTIRRANASNIPALEVLIADSARRLSNGYYSEAETEAAIAHVFGVDSDLVADGSYLVMEEGAALLGCGGWSARRTLFGGDRFEGRAAGLLDPTVDAARIRAFFVAPDQARAGIGTALLAACEEAAIAAGFGAATLMATLPGVPFYARHGYRAQSGITLGCGGVALRFVPMDKTLAPGLASAAHPRQML